MGTGSDLTTPSETGYSVYRWVGTGASTTGLLRYSQVNGKDGKAKGSDVQEKELAQNTDAHRRKNGKQKYSTVCTFGVESNEKEEVAGAKPQGG